MFSVVRGPINTSQKLNNDLHQVSLWDNKWKMSVNPDPSKQAQEVIFSRNINKVYHSPHSSNNSTVQQISSQKHLRIHLDEELTFKHHINGKINKANKGIGIIRKLKNIIPRSALLTIHGSFIRPHLDYGDVIHDQPENESFSSKAESVQYNVSYNRRYNMELPRKAIPVIQSRSFARVWNTHFIIFSFRARDSFPEKIFKANLPFVPPIIIIS